MLLQSLMVLALATGLDDDDKATLIVGTWTASVTENGETSNFTFSKDGKLKAVINEGKKESTNEWTYKIEKDELLLIRVVDGKEQEKRKNKIKELTKEKMVLDDHGKELVFKRKK
jgi:uncharacterized protein (TIGR03066 family)